MTMFLSLGVVLLGFGIGFERPRGFPDAYRMRQLPANAFPPGSRRIQETTEHQAHRP